MEELEARLTGPPRPNLQVLNEVLESVAARDEPWARYIKGRVLFMLQRDEEAFTALEEASQQDPSLHQASFYAGLVLRYLDRGEEAEVFLKKADDGAADEDPSLRNKYSHALGNALMASGKAEQAIAAYKNAVNILPTFASLSALGSGYLQMGNEEEGIGALQKALDGVEEDQLNDSHMNCLFNLGTILMKKLRYTEALPLFLSAEQITPQDGAVVSKVIQCHSFLGNQAERDEAIHRLRQLRKNGLIQQPKFCREQILTEKGNVLCYEFFEFSGEFGRPFFMMIWENSHDGGLPKYTSMGSYHATNELSSNANRPPGHRTWHLDAYFADGAHQTLGFFQGLRPSYDSVRESLLKGIQGEAKVVSSFNPN